MGGPFGSFRRLGAGRDSSSALGGVFGAAREDSGAGWLPRERSARGASEARGRGDAGWKERAGARSGLRASSPAAQPRRTKVTAPEPAVRRALPAGAGAARPETGEGGRNRLTGGKPLDGTRVGAWERSTLPWPALRYAAPGHCVDISPSHAFRGERAGEPHFPSARRPGRKRDRPEVTRTGKPGSEFLFHPDEPCCLADDLAPEPACLSWSQAWTTGSLDGFLQSLPQYSSIQ